MKKLFLIILLSGLTFNHAFSQTDKTTNNITCDTLSKQLADARESLIGEMSGTSGSGKVGCGPICAEKKQTIEKIQNEINKMCPQNSLPTKQ